jgi:hypothetical protein
MTDIFGVTLGSRGGSHCDPPLLPTYAMIELSFRMEPNPGAKRRVGGMRNLQSNGKM